MNLLSDIAFIPFHINRFLEPHIPSYMLNLVNKNYNVPIFLSRDILEAFSHAFNASKTTDSA